MFYVYIDFETPLVVICLSKHHHGLGSRYGPNCACGLKEWVYKINKFAEEEMNDYVENINAYLDNTFSDSSPRSPFSDGGESSMCDSQTSSSTGNKKFNESIDESRSEAKSSSVTWASVGGYIHPQPGSRLMQYAMGWLPDKTLNPSTIYSNHLMNNTDNPIEPSVEVCIYIYIY
jgi:hypothetical protein